MNSRGSLYSGALLIMFGGLFLLAQIGERLTSFLGIRVGWGGLWPLIIMLVGFAFLLPIAVWWDRHEKISGLVIPGLIVTTNGLILLYQNTTGDWASWAYLWTLEPLAVAAGLVSLYYLGPRSRGLLVAAAIVGGISLFFFLIFASAFGGVIRYLGPLALIGVGILVLIEGARRRALDDGPR